MITYKNSYLVDGKQYADIIAREKDKIFVDDLCNGSSLRIIDATNNADVLMYFDQEVGLFRQSDNGSTGNSGFLTVLPTTTFTIENTGGTNRQRFADALDLSKSSAFYFDVEMQAEAQTFLVEGKKDASDNIVFTIASLGQIVANVAESQEYGEPGMYIVSPMLDMMAGREMSIKIYVSSFGMMDKYGH